LSAVVPLPQTGVRVLGRYALYDEIAAGGMATVHIGRLLGPVGFSRTVAIKRLHAQFAKDPEFVSMFLDEARLAARIRHPNVIGTLDVVALAGELFLVMEYVPGESFARLWRTARDNGRPIPVPIVIAIMVGVLEGLHAAHDATNDRGEPLALVHRDVSPHNILVGTDGIARVLDFGVAKAAGRLQTTRDGQLKGKISYMAPEQVHGIVDRTTDVYAAAVVLWEALTGRRLFFAENEARTLANVLYPKVDPPSRHVRGVSAALDAVVLKALSPNPANRYPTARDMARALQMTVPPAPAFAVGDWVESTAGTTIQSRATRVASIERTLPPDSEFPPPMAVPTPRPFSSSSVALRAPASGASVEPSGAFSNVGARSPYDGSTRAAGPGGRRSKRRTAAAIGVASLLFGVGSLAAIEVARRAPEPPPGIPLSQASTSTNPGVNKSRPVAPAAPPPTPSASASVSASASPPPPLLPAPSGHPSQPPVHSVRPALPPPRSAGDGEFDHVIDSRK
jgi:serine/threonine-protein kinase